MPVLEALRGSCAIPFFFSPVKGPEGDLLVDGCITDCTPLRALGKDVDPSR
jgi:predicted acylesterase/phospholipase RssA